MASPKTSLPTVLFQAPNSIGLGHINRLAAIALALRQEEPAVACAFAIGGFDHGLLGALGLPWVSLPPVPPLMSGRDWRAWPPANRERLLRNFAEATLMSFQPAVIVFDCIPHEMVFLVAVERNIPFCFVARSTRSLELYGVRIRSVLDHAAAIIVPHERAEFALPRQWENKTHYVGTIVRRQRGSANPVDLGRLSEPRIVITGGGGGYPGTSAFYNLALEACRQSRKDIPAVSPILVTGPLFQEWNRTRLNDAVLLPSHWDMLGLFEHAELIICQAGYNTVAEVLHSGKPVICIPADRDVDDQTERARLVACRYPRFSVLENPTVDMLSARIVSIVQSGATGRVPEATDPSADAAILAARVVANVIRTRSVGPRMPKNR